MKAGKSLLPQGIAPTRALRESAQQEDSVGSATPIPVVTGIPVTKRNPTEPKTRHFSVKLTRKTRKPPNSHHYNAVRPTDAAFGVFFAFFSLVARVCRPSTVVSVRRPWCPTGEVVCRELPAFRSTNNRGVSDWGVFLAPNACISRRILVVWNLERLCVSHSRSLPRVCRCVGGGCARRWLCAPPCGSSCFL